MTNSPSPRLQDQVALITGGGTGIGRATAVLFASEGADVVVNYSRSQAEAEETVSLVEGLGRRAVAIQANVADDAQVQTMFATAHNTFGKLDILVNNAATTHMVPYTDLDGMDDQKWDDILSVNVKGVFHCMRAAIRIMREQSSQGQIVNVSSISGITGQGSSVAYAASKAAVINMTRGMAKSEAPKIRINAVAPGVVETRWIAGWEKFTDPHKSITPLGRHAQPEDIATTIFGLAINPFITGQTITIDGGRTLA